MNLYGNQLEDELWVWYRNYGWNSDVETAVDIETATIVHRYLWFHGQEQFDDLNSIAISSVEQRFPWP